MKIKDTLQLVRFQNLIIIAITQLVLAFSVWEDLQFTNFILLVLFTTVIAAAGNIINDIFDLAIDQINKPEKVIINHSISTKTAWKLYTFLQVLSFAIALYFLAKGYNQVLYLYFFTSISLFLYSKWLKKSLLLGNLLVSFLCALTPAIFIICQPLLIQNTSLPKGIDFFINFAFLITLAREIIKDIEDAEGDKAQGAKTLAIVMGTNTAKFVAAIPLLWILLQVFVLSTGITQGIERQITIANYFALFALELPIIASIYQLFKAKTIKQFHSLSVFFKIIMLLGLIWLVLLVI